MAEAALIQNKKKDLQGNDVVVINSSSQKTGKKYYERIVLRDYSLDFSDGILRLSGLPL